MNRLQVGDECYVRNGTGSIFKAFVSEIYEDGLLVQIPAKRGVCQHLCKGLENYHSKNKQRLHAWSLVYPFPCVKDLAQ